MGISKFVPAAVVILAAYSVTSSASAMPPQKPVAPVTTNNLLHNVGGYADYDRPYNYNGYYDCGRGGNCGGYYYRRSGYGHDYYSRNGCRRYYPSSRYYRDEYYRERHYSYDEPDRYEDD